jgi:hypothetical protein
MELSGGGMGAHGKPPTRPPISIEPAETRDPASPLGLGRRGLLPNLDSVFPGESATEAKMASEVCAIVLGQPARPAR